GANDTADHKHSQHDEPFGCVEFELFQKLHDERKYSITPLETVPKSCKIRIIKSSDVLSGRSLVHQRHFWRAGLKDGSVAASIWEQG
ncbi:MAG: hypothetical protein ACT4QE_18660, partial [Anaerolineales bacterium]